MNRNLAFALLLSILLFSTNGCVERKLSINSIPRGASVHFDGKYAGITPLSIGFTYYGNHSIRLSYNGYITVVGTVKLSPPLYGRPGIDFIAENACPFVFRDTRSVSFTLEKAAKADADEVLIRTRRLKESFKRLKSKSSENDEEK